MREARYLCRWTGTGRVPGTLSEFDPGDPLRSEIQDDVTAALPTLWRRGGVLDLRTFEEWRDKSGGWCIVTLEAEDSLHQALALKYQPPPLTKAAIDSVIGQEATDEPFTTAREYVERIHRRRMARLVLEKRR